MKKYIFAVVRFWIIILAVIPVLFQCGQKDVPVGKLIEDYIKEWRQFYPSRALAAGDKEAASRFENLSPQQVQKWLRFNASILEKLNRFGSFKSLPLDDRIDARLLRRQILTEIENWEKDRLHENSPGLYAGMIAQALTHILARDILSPAETVRAIMNRLQGIDTLCDAAVGNLKNGSPQRTQRSAAGLEKTAQFYEKNLPDIAKKWLKSGEVKDFEHKARETAGKIRQLANHIKEKLVPRMTIPDTLGKENYSGKLKIYTDSSLTPQELEEISFKEIEQVRRMMAGVAGEFWEEQNPGKEKPTDFRVLMDDVLETMESHRQDNQQDFLNHFKELIDRAEKFVIEKKIASLPGKRTLFTDLSPAHFAGAAVGGVYAAGPFNPDAVTLFYLPTVPDSAPEKVKEGFYRSFNNHFNTMIITHEIFPGHYLQLKMASSYPHLVRSLFADDLFVEGWATLCEQITLDAGWDGDNNLTRLAHLRKRLENAVRAYTSVQVHCHGWNREKLVKFAVEKGLLAPQFAINLWDRVMNSPLQLTSYFLGFRAFVDLLEKEKKRLGDRFRIRDFSDKILRAGAVPLDELPAIVVKPPT
jgi:uncharacterized protein (DUF885 family)